MHPDLSRFKSLLDDFNMREFVANFLCIPFSSYNGICFWPAVLIRNFILWSWLCFQFCSIPENTNKIDGELALSFIRKCFPTWYFLMSICILDVKFDRAWEALFKEIFLPAQGNVNESSLWWQLAWLFTLQLQESSGCFACDNSPSGFSYQKTLLARSQAMFWVYCHFTWCLVHIMMQMHTSS